MLMKHKYLLVLLFLVLENAAKSQNAKNQPLAVIESLPGQIVKNANGLKLKVLIQNNNNNVTKVYKYLVEGYAADPKANLNLVIEQKGKSGYCEYSRGLLYQPVPDDSPVDTIEKIELKAKESAVNFIHLDDAYLFVPGSYRVKCIYKNNLKQNNKISSSWVYFRVTATIPIKHYYNE